MQVFYSMIKKKRKFNSSFCGLFAALLTWETGRGFVQNSARQCGLSTALLTWETGQGFVQILQGSVDSL